MARTRSRSWTRRRMTRPWRRLPTPPDRPRDIAAMTPAAEPVSTASRPRGLSPWARLLYALQRPWVKPRIERPDTAEGFDPDRRWCYVLERDGLSYELILEQACREAG